MGIETQITDRAAVIAAIDEFNQLGRDSFLEKYHFGKARKYFLHFEGQIYDSKAIMGAAHGFQFPEKGPLALNTFSGGDETVVAQLEKLGFEVIVVDSGAGDPACLEGQDGDLDSIFAVTDAPREGTDFSITLESRGGGRNNDYARCLEILLDGLANLKSRIVQIQVVSSKAMKLQPSDRTLELRYPIQLAPNTDANELRKKIGQKQMLIAQAENARGGNSTKRIQIDVATDGRISGTQFLEGIVPISGWLRRRSFILTWNPGVWDDWTTFESDVRRTQNGERVGGRWSSGTRTQGVRVGDLVFLLRQGDSNRGLIGIGRAVTSSYGTGSPIFEDFHYEESRGQTGKLAHYIQLEWQYLRETGEEIPTPELEVVCPEVDWNHILSSGQMLPPICSPKLLALLGVDGGLTGQDRATPSADQPGRVTLVSVPPDASDIFETGVRKGIWGWSKADWERPLARRRIEALAPGRPFLLVLGGPTSSPTDRGRRGPQTYRKVATGYVASASYEGTEEVWQGGSFPRRIRIDFQVLAEDVPSDYLGGRNRDLLATYKDGLPHDGDMSWTSEDFGQLVGDLRAFGEVLIPSAWTEPSGPDEDSYKGRQLDRRVTTTIRTESFRKDLFGTRETAECALCGRTLSVKFLWASHIKPRSACSMREKADVNVVMSNCLLGCDQLYERRIIAVGPDGIIRLANLNALPGVTPEQLKELVEEIGVRLGERCPVFGTHNRDYFAWHLSHSGAIDTRKLPAGTNVAIAVE